MGDEDKSCVLFTDEIWTELKVAFFCVTFSYDEDEILQLNDKEVRPRARTKLDWDEVGSCCLNIFVSNCVKKSP